MAAGGDIFRAARQGEPVWLVEPGLERFARVLAARQRDGRLIYVRQEFPQGPEFEVQAAWQDGLEDLDHVAGVPPALELSFRWMLWQKRVAEEKRRELEELARLEAEEAERVARNAAFRENLEREIARRRDPEARFEDAARAALAVSGAELLDHRAGVQRGETVVQFRFRDRRFECVVQTRTLRIIDAGVCLIDHANDIRGDTRFTLESLPGVLNEAIDRGVLVVFRHVPAPARPAGGQQRQNRRERRRDRNRRRRR